MASPLMIIVGAEKGGVGKTTLCRALAAWMESPELKDLPRPQMVDCQYPRGDLSRYHHDATILNVRDFRDQMRLFDNIAGLKIVDLPAGEFGIMLRGAEDAMLLDMVRNKELRMAVLHVLGPTVSSLEEIADANELLGGAAQHFIVKNRINETKWDWDGSKYANSLAALANVTIDVPHLAAEAAQAMSKSPVPILEFMKDTPAARDDKLDEPISRACRGAVGKWLSRCAAGFEKVGLGEMIKETFR